MCGEEVIQRFAGQMTTIEATSRSNGGEVEWIRKSMGLRRDGTSPFLRGKKLRFSLSERVTRVLREGEVGLFFSFCFFLRSIRSASLQRSGP